MDSVTTELRAHLPFARRFARALSGGQASGDAYVMQALEALIADRTMFSRFNSPKMALYATLLKLWNSIDVNNTHDQNIANSLAGIADRNLQSLTAPSRQAFLLVTMEGFQIEQAAQILELRAEQVQQLLEDASEEIAKQIQTDVLIIEDEPLIAIDLEAAMQDIGHNVIGIAATQGEAVNLAAGAKPGLILADIHLADGTSGIDAANDLLAHFSVPVIFITAFPERLLTGEKPEPAFLITKPFDLSVVKAVTSQALFFEEKAKLAARERSMDPDLGNQLPA